jgi:hypothetical protein
LTASVSLVSILVTKWSPLLVASEVRTCLHPLSKSSTRPVPAHSWCSMQTGGISLNTAHTLLLS